MYELFNPASIAVIGASTDTRKAGGRFFKDLIANNYRGLLYAVNPNYRQVLGIESYSSIEEIPGEVDLAIVTVPSKGVPSVVEQCCRKGVKYVIVHSAGFSELGEEGKALEKQMLAALSNGRTRLIGPNCMGIYVPSSRINTIVYGSGITEAGHMAFVGQSGWVTENVVVLGKERGLGFSKVVSIGNQSDITIEEMVQYLAGDPDTYAIALYVEGLKNGREFFRIVRNTAPAKPVIVWKSGRSAVGARAASSHTGSLAGSGAVFDALATQTGLVQVRDLDELMDMMVGFSCPVAPKGNRVAILCESGGGAVSGSDAAEAYGLEVPTLSPGAQQRLVDTLTGKVPPFATPRNPVDIVWGPAENAGALFQQCGRIMLDETDAAVMLDYQRFDEALASQMARLRDETGKPVFIAPGYVSLARAGMATLTARGVPAFNTPARALRVLGEVVKYVRKYKTGD